MSRHSLDLATAMQLDDKQMFVMIGRLNKSRLGDEIRQEAANWLRNRTIANPDIVNEQLSYDIIMELGSAVSNCFNHGEWDNMETHLYMLFKEEEKRYVCAHYHHRLADRGIKSPFENDELHMFNDKIFPSITSIGRAMQMTRMIKEAKISFSEIHHIDIVRASALSILERFGILDNYLHLEPIDRLLILEVLCRPNSAYSIDKTVDPIKRCLPIVLQDFCNLEWSAVDHPKLCNLLVEILRDNRYPKFKEQPLQDDVFMDSIMKRLIDVRYSDQSGEFLVNLLVSILFLDIAMNIRDIKIPLLADVFLSIGQSPNYFTSVAYGRIPTHRGLPTPGCSMQELSLLIDSGITPVLLVILPDEASPLATATARRMAAKGVTRQMNSSQAALILQLMTAWPEAVLQGRKQTMRSPARCFVMCDEAYENESSF